MLLPSQQKFFDDESKAKILTIFGGVCQRYLPLWDLIEILNKRDSEESKREPESENKNKKQP